MAAISHVFTIRRAAQILVRDEDLLWELSDQLEPEDGKLWVYAIDGAETPAFMASRLFAKLSRIRSIAPVNLKTSVPRCSAYAYVADRGLQIERRRAPSLSCRCSRPPRQSLAQQSPRRAPSMDLGSRAPATAARRRLNRS